MSQTGKKVVLNRELEALLDKDLSQMQQELTDLWNKIQQNISHHLKAFGNN